MICECGGILLVIRVEEYPEDVKDKINYSRVCDVQCVRCNKILYSQPYDFGNKLNVFRNLKKGL
jgi:hypothetical protein